MSLTAMLVLGVALGAAPEQGEDGKKYELDLAGTSKTLKAGDKGTFKLQIKPMKGFKISAEAPLKIKLAAEGLGLTKERLGHKDAEDPKSTAPRFSVSFKAPNESGKKKIEANASFFVCDASLCERRQEKITVAVNVD